MRRAFCRTRWPQVIASVQAALGRRVAVPVERLVVCGDHHALGVEVIVKTLAAEFAPDPGIADAAQRRDPGNKYVQNNLQLLEDSYRKGKAIE